MRLLGLGTVLKWYILADGINGLMRAAGSTLAAEANCVGVADSWEAKKMPPDG